MEKIKGIYYECLARGEHLSSNSCFDDYTIEDIFIMDGCKFTFVTNEETVLTFKFSVFVD